MQFYFLRRKGSTFSSNFKEHHYKTCDFILFNSTFLKKHVDSKESRRIKTGNFLYNCQYLSPFVQVLLPLQRIQKRITLSSNRHETPTKNQILPGKQTCITNKHLFDIETEPSKIAPGEGQVWRPFNVNTGGCLGDLNNSKGFHVSFLP